MKMYRDMTASERRTADRQHQQIQKDRKYDAEQRMKLWDSLTPAERAWELEWRERRAAEMDVIITLCG
jgi:hypothetical protein